MLFAKNGSPRMGGQTTGHGRARRHHHDEGRGPEPFGGQGLGGPRAVRDVRDAREILADARRRLYRLLADDEAPDRSTDHPEGGAAG